MIYDAEDRPETDQLRKAVGAFRSLPNWVVCVQAEALRELGAWDPRNVTEDADLGMRIARRGWGVQMMASVTEEEANSRTGNWIRQRSRWIKGYYQTWLVHMRSPWQLWRDLGLRQFCAFHLTLGFSALPAST